MKNIFTIIKSKEIYFIISKIIFSVFILFPIIMGMIVSIFKISHDYILIFTISLTLYLLYYFQSFRYHGKLNSSYFIGIIFAYVGHFILFYIYYITNTYSGPGSLSGLIYIIFVVPMVIMYIISYIVLNNNNDENK